MFKVASVVVCLVLVRVFSGTLSFARPAPPEAPPLPDTDMVCIHDPYGDEVSLPVDDDATHVYLFDAAVPEVDRDAPLRLAQPPRPDGARTPTRSASSPRLSIQSGSGARAPQGARGGASSRRRVGW